MKKHQKVLLGIMSLSLAGGIGTAVALNFTASGDKTTSLPTDSAIYLYWGTDEQNTATTVKVDNFTKDVAQYRPLVVAPQSSKTVAGTVTVTFTLEAGQKTTGGATASSDASGNTYVIPGLTMKVYESQSSDFDSESSYSYKGESKSNSVVSLSVESSAANASGSATFNVTATESQHQTTTHWYLLEFIWNGTRPNQNEVFGGNLTISQSFNATTNA